MGLVRLTGVEPVRPSGHKHLKLASLPIPAQPQTAVIFDRLVIILFWQGFVNGFFKILYCSPNGKKTAPGIGDGSSVLEGIFRTGR